jgi:hypothetical protein
MKSCATAPVRANGSGMDARGQTGSIIPVCPHLYHQTALEGTAVPSARQGGAGCSFAAPPDPTATGPSRPTPEPSRQGRDVAVAASRPASVGAFEGYRDCGNVSARFPRAPAAPHRSPGSST